jgi:hypothetical protein
MVKINGNLKRQLEKLKFYHKKYPIIKKLHYQQTYDYLFSLIIQNAEKLTQISIIVPTHWISGP